MFASGPGDLGSIPGRIIPKTQKMVLDASLLNTQHYKAWIKGKVEQSREGVAPSTTHWCSSYRKGSLRVTLDYGRQLYLLISSFNGISTFVDYLRPKPSLSTIYFIARESDNGIQAFPNGIRKKVSVMVRLELELTYFEAAVQHFSHYTSENPLRPLNLWSA